METSNINISADRLSITTILTSVNSMINSTCNDNNINQLY